jgi:hypothetical protein
MSHKHNFECVHRELLSRSETNNATITTTRTTQPIDNPMIDQSSQVQTTTQHSSTEKTTITTTTTTTKESSVSKAATTTTTELLTAIAVFPRYHK